MAEWSPQVRLRVPRRVPSVKAAGMPAPDGDVTAAGGFRVRTVALVPGDADQAWPPPVPQPALLRYDWQTHLFHASIQTRYRKAWKVGRAPAAPPGGHCGHGLAATRPERAPRRFRRGLRALLPSRRRPPPEQ